MNAVKACVNGLFLAIAFPVAALSGFGRVTQIFRFGAQMFALVPGLPGDYGRIAYYRLTLRRCSLESRISFGSFFAHPEVVIGERSIHRRVLYSWLLYDRRPDADRLSSANPEWAPTAQTRDGRTNQWRGKRRARTCGHRRRLLDRRGVHHNGFNWAEHHDWQWRCSCTLNSRSHRRRRKSRSNDQRTTEMSEVRAVPSGPPNPSGTTMRRVWPLPTYAAGQVTTPRHSLERSSLLHYLMMVYLFLFCSRLQEFFPQVRLSALIGYGLLGVVALTMRAGSNSAHADGQNFDRFYFLGSILSAI